MSTNPLQPTLGELVATMTSQVSALVKGEIDLFKAQVQEKGQRFGVGIGLFVGAAVMGFFAFCVLVATFVLVLDLWLPAWAAALIVAAVFLLVAAVLALVGKKQIDAGKEVKPAVVDNLKGDLALVKDSVKEGLSS